MKVLNLTDPSTMTTDEFRESMDTLELLNRDFASLIGVSQVTVSTWRTGKVKIPKPIGVLIRSLLELKEAREMLSTPIVEIILSKHHEL